MGPTALSQAPNQSADFGIQVLGKWWISELQPREMDLGLRSFDRGVCLHLRNNSSTGTEVPNQFPLATDTSQWPTSACQRQREDATDVCGSMWQ